MRLAPIPSAPRSLLSTSLTPPRRDATPGLRPFNSDDGFEGSAARRATAAPVYDSEAAKRDRVLAIAQGEVGTKETGDNEGPVTKYPAFFGRDAEKYCADFVSYVCTQAGIPMNNPSANGLKNELIAEGKWKGKKDPQPGDIVFFDFDGDGHADHVGIVESVDADGTVHTIEGNTGTDTDKSDQGVNRRTRDPSVIMGYASP